MIRLPPAVGLVCLVMLLGGCADFSEVDKAARETITDPPAPPRITPIDAIRDQAATLTITDADTAAVQERAMTLRSRAMGLEAPVGDPATVARLTAALATP